MKIKLFFLVSLISFASQMKGQDYIPLIGDTNVWTYSAWPWDFISIVTAEDSVYNEIYYKKIKHEGWGYKGLLREDSLEQKVWYIEPDSLNERIIYDFSLNEGDSIWLQWNSDALGSMLQDGWYFVDSIRTNNFFGINRRIFYLDNPINEDIEFCNSNRPYIQWIEGIGANLHPIYFIINDCAADLCGIAYYYGASLICAFNNNVHIYKDCFFELLNLDCFIPAGMNEIHSLERISIYPNPASRFIHIQSGSITIFDINIIIRDLYGNTILFDHLKNQDDDIDISDLMQGLYFITLQSENLRVTKKLYIIKN